ncbi:hypothetical protein BASA61_002843, partial [Batrachochytrium salamandrivorans]
MQLSRTTNDSRQTNETLESRRSRSRDICRTGQTSVCSADNTRSERHSRFNSGKPKPDAQTIRRNKKEEFPRFYQSTRARLSNSSDAYDTDRKKIAMLGTLLTGNAYRVHPYLKNRTSFSTIFRLGQGSRTNFRANIWRNYQEQVSEQDSCSKTRKSALFDLCCRFRQLTAISTGTMLLSDRNFITDSAVKLKMLWYTSTTLLQSQQLWIWQFESITGYLKDARNNHYIIRDIHPVILQQLYHFSLRNHSSNQIFETRRYCNSKSAGS